MRRRIGLVSTPLSMECAPPEPQLVLAYWNSILKGLDVSIYDLDLEIFKWFGRDLDTYNTLICIVGGFAFAPPLVSRLSFDEFMFDTLPGADLLLAWIFGEGEGEIMDAAVSELSVKYSISPTKTSQLIRKFEEFIDHFAKEIVSENDLLIMNVPSPSAVVTSILLAYRIKQIDKKIEIVGAGQYINVPAVNRLALALGAFDHLITGDEEIGVESLKRGKLEQAADAVPLYEDLDDLPFPDYEGMALEEYPLRYGLLKARLETSRGCPYHCNFCSLRLRWGSQGGVREKYRVKSIDRVIREVSFLSEKFNISHITFRDEIINADPRRFGELLSRLSSTNIIYGGEGRGDLLSDELIDGMQKAGFTHVILGVESFSPKSIEIYNKGSSDYLDRVRGAILKLISKDIIPQINIITCHPYEEYADVVKSAKAFESFVTTMKRHGLLGLFTSFMGNICLNYPSAMYFDVLRDSRFLIVYHKVPEYLERLVPPLVKKCVESIPYKAIRKDFESYRHVNKVDFSKQLYSYVYDEQAGKRLFSSTIRALSNHKEVFLKGWTAGNVRVICRKSPVQVQKASAMGALICMIAERGEITTSELLRKVRSEGIFDEGDLVTILLSLAEGETIEFRRGSARWT